MVAKAPSVVVLPGNETGSSPVVRIRGTNSLSLSNAPIYVIDGVRLTSSSVGVGTGGTTTSFLNDVSPEDIEDIEIVKGPSAATLVRHRRRQRRHRHHDEEGTRRRDALDLLR